MMIDTVLKNVSLVGRIAYAILCAEKYFTSVYPEKDWLPVFQRLWTICNSSDWENWREVISEILPECLEEFDDFEKLGYKHLSKEEYQMFKELYHGTGEDVNLVLNLIWDMEETYAYSSIDGSAEESLKLLEELIGMLVKKHIELPNPQLVTFSKFSEDDGWGKPFDGTKLSQYFR